MENILIYEPNAYHYEILPGFIKYFSDLNYHVDLLMHEHKELGDEKCLCSFEIGEYYYDDQNQLEILQQIMKEKEYSFLFLSSYDCMKNGVIINVFDMVKEIDNSKYGIIGCYHGLKALRENKAEDLVRNNRVITISEAYVDGMKCNMVNPHFFGDFRYSFNKNEVTCITSIGVKNERKELENTIQNILKQKTNFKINIIGRYNKNNILIKKILFKLFYPFIKCFNIHPYCEEIYRPIKNKKIYHYIFDLGALKFEDMYKVIQSSDFLLLNVDVTNEEFKRFRTSGTKQLSLGFIKPCILHEDVARFYGFSEQNCIMYRSGKLEEAFYRAITLSQDEYANMCLNLQTLQKNMYSESLENLNTMLNELKRKKNGI